MWAPSKIQLSCLSKVLFYFSLMYPQSHVQSPTFITVFWLYWQYFSWRSLSPMIQYDACLSWSIFLLQCKGQTFNQKYFKEYSLLYLVFAHKSSSRASVLSKSSPPLSQQCWLRWGAMFWQNFYCLPLQPSSLKLRKN